MLKISVCSEDKSKVKEILENDSFFKYFDCSEVEGGFELDGMNYCTIIYDDWKNEFTLIGQTSDRALNDVISDVFQELPEVGLKGALLLGDDNYRKYYWIHSAPGSAETTVDYAIDISEYGGPDHAHNIGAPLSGAWFKYLYGTDYGIEYMYIESIEAFRDSVKAEIEKYEININDKKLGLDLTEIYGLLSDIMDCPVDEMENLKEIFQEIKKKYKEDDTYKDEISNIIINNLASMASSIDGLTRFELWANVVKGKMSKKKFFEFFGIEEDLDDLEDENYIELLSQIAEVYDGFPYIECDDFIDLCDEYGITTEIDEDAFNKVKERIGEMDFPDLDEM